MTADLLLAFLAFAIVMSITPGPNNAMMIASGATFGFRRSVPHILGIDGGTIVMIVAVGLGLGGLFEAWPPLYEVLRWVGAAWLLWLAWHLARSGGSGAVGPVAHPMTFLGAAAFQWVNPKAWVMSLGAVAAYIPQDGYVRNLLLIAVVFGLIAIPSVSLWAGFGIALRRLLDAPGRSVLFNRAMAILLVLSIIPILRH
jgi:threonine/homoserine/homoserine lactone efflux protein